MSDYGLSKLTELLRLAAPAMLTLAMFVGGYAASADDGGPVMRTYIRYVSWLDREFRHLFVEAQGKKVAWMQLAGLYGLFALQALVGIEYWYVALFLVVLGPTIWIRNERKKRLAKIEDQLDGFVLKLGNALKSIPSINAAFQSLVPVLEAPIKQEVELAVKEMKVGSSLDQALLHMAVRIGSRPVDSAVSAILIGRQVGGNLPKVLTNTAEALREMRRLDGVVRTKTAEAKSQIVVIAILPFGMIYAINYMAPQMFEPLFESFLGYTVLVICAGAYLGALVAARRFSRVDI